MKYLDLTLPEPAANVALDEQLLDACEAGREPEILRVWTPPSPAVVVGYANSPEREVDLSACAQDGVPVIRRCSGGGAVVLAPGMLCYAVVVRISRSAELVSISQTNAFMLRLLARAVGNVAGADVRSDGLTDLVVGGRKCAGNSQRRRRECVLFHGAILLQADIGLMERWLRMPSREPDYRAGRSHTAFVTNLGGEAARLKEALRVEFGAERPVAA